MCASFQEYNYMYTSVHLDVVWESGAHQTAQQFDPSPKTLIWL